MRAAATAQCVLRKDADALALAVHAALEVDGVPPPGAPRYARWAAAPRCGPAGCLLAFVPAARRRPLLVGAAPVLPRACPGLSFATASV